MAMHGMKAISKFTLGKTITLMITQSRIAKITTCNRQVRAVTGRLHLKMRRLAKRQRLNWDFIGEGESQNQSLIVLFSSFLPSFNLFFNALNISEAKLT